MSPEGITEVMRAADHLASAVAKLTAAERETPEGVELVDMAHDVERLWRQLDETETDEQKRRAWERKLDRYGTSPQARAALRRTAP